MSARVIAVLLALAALAAAGAWLIDTYRPHTQVVLPREDVVPLPLY